jgi:hypothetical protein
VPSFLSSSASIASLSKVVSTVSIPSDCLWHIVQPFRPSNQHHYHHHQPPASLVLLIPTQHTLRTKLSFFSCAYFAKQLVAQLRHLDGIDFRSFHRLPALAETLSGEAITGSTSSNTT